ncbi:MAG TPA: hypothetical protein PKI01_01160 [Bacteroidales bacterium]|nr:hypothetical protein [Bacteroidales bacterium]
MVALIKIPLLKNETGIDSWDLYYTFPNGQSFFGIITITNKRIFFETMVKGGVEALLNASAIFTNHVPNNVVLSKKHIKKIETIKDVCGNKALVTLDNGEIHILDRKMLAIDKIIEALKVK